MHSRDNWDDLRFALAVARTGSVSKAAKILGVNHATVLRRVAALEERHGTEIFEKTVKGYRIAPGMQRIIDAMTSVEDAILSVDRAVEGVHAPLRGTVHVTSTDTFCQSVLPPLVAHLRTESPELRVELMSSNFHLDLSRLDADLTVRPADRLSDELEGSSPATLGMAVYCSRKNARPGWIGLSGPLSRTRASAWMNDNVPKEKMVASVDSFQTLRHLIANGVGQGILPCILGDEDPALARMGDGSPPFQVPIWVAGHKDLSHVQRITQTRAKICDYLESMSARLAGNA